VEVWYDGDGKMYFKGGWSQFAEDHDLHEGFFMIFDYPFGTSKFDVKIYDGTQCQKEYEAEVHFSRYSFYVISCSGYPFVCFV
jgi:hypothetical protein